MHVCFLILDPPKIVEFTLSSDIPPLIASSNATVTCNATGFPAPNVTLLKNGSPLDLNDDFLSVSSSSGSLHQSVTIVLTNLDFFDSAEYSCNATNQLASFQRTSSVTSLYTIQCKLATTSIESCFTLLFSISQILQMLH